MCDLGVVPNELPVMRSNAVFAKLPESTTVTEPRAIVISEFGAASRPRAVHNVDLARRRPSSSYSPVPDAAKSSPPLRTHFASTAAAALLRQADVSAVTILNGFNLSLV